VKNLSFTLRHGSTTALVGPTGAGKSTIANLLLRYYDVEQGNITIGGTNIDQVRLQELRQKISFVSQDPFLFDTSIKENLFLASASASELDLKTALISANAWEFVSSLPDGIDTLIGERGIRLSMGEKQRLTLARAMLKSSPILILDEATSSVDVKTEKQIQDALHDLIKSKTALIIAHRLSTIREADEIIFLEKGNILEKGSHQELIELNGAYADYCKLQENLMRN
jgi:ABC-type multidrug transport system fused ATPase/permease subunit